MLPSVSMRRGWIAVVLVAGCFGEPESTPDRSTDTDSTSGPGSSTTTSTPTSSSTGTATTGGTGTTTTSTSTDTPETDSTSNGLDSTTAERNDVCPYGARIQFDELSQAAALEDFVAPVRIGPDLPYANAAPEGADVVFRSPDLEEVFPHEIDTWRPGGESVFWVRIPRVDDDNAQMLLCVGGEVPPGPETSIWHDFSIVWHFSEEENASPRLVDHSPAGMDVESSTLDAPTRVEGALGFAARADNDNQLLRIRRGQTLSVDTDITLEVVYSPIELGSFDELLRQTGSFSVRGNDGMNAQSSVEFTLEPEGNTITTFSGEASAEGETHYLTATYSVSDGGLEVCHDAESPCGARMIADDQLLTMASGVVEIGSVGYSLDEVRVSTVRRSKGWIEATARGIDGTLLIFLAL